MQYRTAKPMDARGRGAFSRIERPAVRRRAAFTLIELLLVIAIIAILISILIPSVSAVLRASKGAEVAARITMLDTAARQYAKSNANWFPGQRQWSSLGSSGQWTGSQMLAHCVFVDENGGFPGGDRYNSDLLGTVEGRQDTISDGYSDAMAICYYPSKKGQGDNAAGSQYSEQHNSVYTNPHLGPNANFTDYIIDERAGNNRPFNPGEFLLIAPGADRKYFTHDDIRNFKN